jgi:hypothetical protein
MSDAPQPAAGANLLAEVAGWYGTAAILSAFALSSFHVLDVHDIAYLLLNLTGAACVGWTCWRKRAWQAFWLEAVWALVAAIGLARALLG